jgi:hypothetical protein
MASKGVTDRQRVAKALVAAARTHAQEVGERVQEILSPALQEGQTLPDLTAFQEVLAQHLENLTAAIIAADETHLEEQDDDVDPRRRRDDAAAALNATLVKIREALAGAFGRESIRELVGLQGSTATEPVVLLRQANRVLERLRQLALETRTSRLDGIQVDPGALADQLQPALDNLALAVQDVDAELRETESTLRVKDRTLDAFDAAVAGTGRILTGFDLLGGFSEFAEKIRLTLPARRRRNVEDDGEPSSPEDAPAAEDSPDGGLPPAVASVPSPVEGDGSDDGS